MTVAETDETLVDVFEEPEEGAGEAQAGDKGEPESAKDSNKTVDDPPKSEPPSDKDQKTVPIAALHDERRRRQEAEDRLAQYERQKSAVEMPDPDSDPDGYKTAMALKISLSREMIMSLDGYKDDFAEMEAHFIKMAQDNPGYAIKMNESPNPALYAYQTAKADKDTQKLKDPAYIEDLVEKEVQKRLAAMGTVQQHAQSKADERKQAAVEIPAISSAPAQGSNSEPPPRLSDLSEIFEGSLF